MARANQKFINTTKLFKFFSIIAILVPLVVFILDIIYFFKGSDGWNYDLGIKIMSWILLVASVMWIVLNIIMFLAAGSTKNRASPWRIRWGLLISLIFVVAVVVVDLLIVYHAIDESNATKIAMTILPWVTILGFIIGTVLSNHILDDLGA